MTERLTPLGVALLALCASAFSLAILSRRPELFLVALPALLVLAALARAAKAPDYAIGRDISCDRLFEGDVVAVTISVSARTPVALLEVLGPLPAGSAVASGRHRAAMSLAAGQTVSWSYDLRFSGRGLHDLGTVVTRARDACGLRSWERRDDETKLLRVDPIARELRSFPRPAHARASAGDYVSTAVGEGVEPGDIRRFAPGDRIRQVNWRASLRLGTLHVTERQRERNADVVLMLDTLAEAGAPPETTLDLGVRAAAALAAVYLARRDRVGLIAYGGVLHWVKPGSGRAQRDRLLDALVRANVVFTYVAKDLGVVPPRVLPPQALVIAITPLLDARFATAAVDLAARGFDLVVLAISPIDVTRATLPPSRAVDLACRLWALERQRQLAELRRRVLRVYEWHPPEPLELALARGSRLRPRMVAAQ
jgi:uncharacterized protein (DUF58 family)